MSSIRRPRACLKLSAEPLLHGGIEALAVEPKQALQAICDLTGEIERSMEGDDGKKDILLLRTIKLSRCILAEPEPWGTLVISVQGYLSLLRIILTHLVYEGCTINQADEKWLNDQLDTYSRAFREPGFSMAQSTGSRVLPAESGSNLFQSAHDFIINGGNFISHGPDPNVQGICEEILRSVSDGNFAVPCNHIVRLQATLEMILRVVCFNTIVLFY